MVNVALLLAILGTGAVVVTYLDFRPLQSFRIGRRWFVHRGHARPTSFPSDD